MKRPVYLVGCGKSKRDHATLARDLYTGQLFQKSYRLATLLAEKNDGHIFILSANHGLLDPFTRVAPYDLAIGTLGAVARKDWGFDVANALTGDLRMDGDPGISGREYVILAGLLYVDAVRFGLTELLSYTPPIQIPMHGLGIGERLSWLNTHLAALAGAERYAEAARADGVPCQTIPAPLV